MYCLVYVKPSLHFKVKAYFITVCNIFMYSLCKCFVEHVWIYIHQGYWPIVFVVPLPGLDIRVDTSFVEITPSNFIEFAPHLSVCLSVSLLQGMVVNLLWKSGRILLWIQLVLDIILAGRCFYYYYFSSFVMCLFRQLSSGLILIVWI